jgi:hypothetical protein
LDDMFSVPKFNSYLLGMSSLPSVLFNKLPMLVFRHLFSSFFNYGTQFYTLPFYTPSKY